MKTDSFPTFYQLFFFFFLSLSFLFLSSLTSHQQRICENGATVQANTEQWNIYWSSQKVFHICCVPFPATAYSAVQSQCCYYFTSHWALPSISKWVTCTPPPSPQQPTNGEQDESPHCVTTVSTATTVPRGASLMTCWPLWDEESNSHVPHTNSYNHNRTTQWLVHTHTHTKHTPSYTYTHTYIHTVNQNYHYQHMYILHNNTQ